MSFSEVYELQKLLDMITIADPIKTLFNPEFEIKDREELSFFDLTTIVVNLRITSLNANGNGDKIQVSMPLLLDTRAIKDVAYFKYIVRKMLGDILLHELDESLYFCNEYVKNPHPK